MSVCERPRTAANVRERPRTSVNAREQTNVVGVGAAGVVAVVVAVVAVALDAAAVVAWAALRRGKQLQISGVSLAMQD